VITEVTLRTVPTRDWVGCLTTFDDYPSAYAAGLAQAEATDIGRKLMKPMYARICAHFPKLEGHIKPEKHLLVPMVRQEDVGAFETHAPLSAVDHILLGGNQRHGG
jgi:hypothetical protein